MSLLFLSLKTIWRKSWTKIWAYVQAGSGAVLLTLSEVNQFVTDPTFKSYLSDIDIPKEITVGLAVLGIVTYVAHGHAKNEDLT